MEILLVFVLLLYQLSVSISWVFGYFTGFGVWLWYCKYYYDGSEKDGKNNWNDFREL